MPEERLGHGAVPGMTLTDNLFLSRYKTDARAFLRGGKLKLIAESALRSATKRIIERMDVRKSAENSSSISPFRR